MKDIRGGLGYVVIKDGGSLFVRLEGVRLVADQRWPERTRELEQAADGYSERFRVRIEGVVRALGLTAAEQADLAAAAADRRLLKVDFIARPRNLIADWRRSAAAAESAACSSEVRPSARTTPSIRTRNRSE